MASRQEVAFAAKKTPKPTGLAITREGGKFTFTWKIPSCKYGNGQQLEYRLAKGQTWTKWTSIEIGKTTTTKSITINPAAYYPVTSTQLHQVEFRVRGLTKNTKTKSGNTTTTIFYDWSDWTSKKYDILKPNSPKASAELSTTQWNVCTFSWATSVDVKSNKWFYRVRWETILVKDCTQTDGSKLKWNSSALGWGTGTSTDANGSHGIPENTAIVANGSYTRWFRVISSGPEGPTTWAYTKHVYAAPNSASIVKADATTTPSGGLQVKTVWTAGQSAANPIDQTIVQYKIAVPGANMSCPAQPDWTDLEVSADTGGKDAANCTIDANLALDQCLWTRVKTQHDTKSSESAPALAKKGVLKDPSGLSVSINTSEFRATITATNNSEVVDSFLAIVFRRSKSPGKDLIVGIMPGQGQSSVTVQCPDWTSDPDIAFGVYACVGTYAAQTRADGAGSYSIKAQMKSAATIWNGGSVPLEPTGVTVSQTDIEGTVRVTWNWTWQDADTAEISWSDHEDAWESTDAPTTYEVSNLYASAWNVSNLAMGRTWYIRVRLKKGDTYGPYCAVKSIDLSSDPYKPALVLSQAVVREGMAFTAYWDYMSADDTEQDYAEICQVTESGGVITYGAVIAHALTARHIDIPCPRRWETGNTYLLSLRVISSSQRTSEWSDPVAITVAEPVITTITQHSLEEVTIPADVEEEETRTVLALTEMPLTLTVTGAGSGDKTTVIIDRAADYQVDRPDESEFNGYEGETISNVSIIGAGQIEVTNENLIGALDDGAAYRLLAIVQDGLGQQDVQTLDFEVHWSHQALIPDARETIRGSAMEMTPIAPEGTVSGDLCDIYRLSLDKPVLIASGVEFGETYVDPYPAIGDNGGHRFVFRTANGDYITADNEIAWLDLADEFDADCSIIDFPGGQIVLQYDLSFSNTWNKEFTETKYLGGSVQGDWGPAVSRTSTMSSVLVTIDDDDMIALLRQLAVYPGACHVRTPDGSSFDADVQVSESRSHTTAGRKVDFSLSITRVDSEGLDALPIEIWEA